MGVIQRRALKVLDTLSGFLVYLSTKSVRATAKNKKSAHKSAATFGEKNEIRDALDYNIIFFRCIIQLPIAAFDI